MKRRLLLALLTLALTACGFHLKGSERGDGHLREISLHWPNGADSTFQNALEAALQQQHITLNDAAAVRLQIDPTDQDRIRTAIGGKGDTQEIELFDSFRATISENGETRGSQTFTARSNVLYRSNAYLGSRAEEAEAHQQLARDNAGKLIRYLNATIR